MCVCVSVCVCVCLSLGMILSVIVCVSVLSVCGCNVCKEVSYHLISPLPVQAKHHLDKILHELETTCETQECSCNNIHLGRAQTKDIITTLKKLSLPAHSRHKREIEYMESVSYMIHQILTDLLSECSSKCGCESVSYVGVSECG